MLLTESCRASEAPAFAVVERGSVVEVGCGLGRLTGAPTVRLFHVLRELLAQRMPLVLVDLRSTGEVDTAVLAVLIDATASGRRSGTRVIVRASPPLRRMADLCRVHCVLEIV